MAGEQDERGGTAELFRNDDLVVRAVGGFASGVCVVTFDSFTDIRTLDRPGFGEGFLLRHGIDAIHVIARENDWYQYAAMTDAMAAVHGATRHYRRVVTYGSSMGAYAAIRLAGLAGAHCALSLSPQFSVDPAAVPFELRWSEAGERFRAVWERTLPFPALEQAYIAYDPDDLDARHLPLFQEHLRFTPVQFPGAGHPITGFLMEVGLLEGMVLQACRGAIDVPALQEAAWQNRERSAQHFLVLANRAAKPRDRIGMLRQAVRLAPGNAFVRSSLGVALANAGQFAEAEAAHHASLEIAPGHPHLLFNQSHAAQAQGDMDRALAIMETAWANSGQASLYQARLSWLRARVARRRMPRASRWWAWLRDRHKGRAPSAGW